MPLFILSGLHHTQCGGLSKQRVTIYCSLQKYQRLSAESDWEYSQIPTLCAESYSLQSFIVVILTDKKTAIKALYSAMTSSLLVELCGDALNKLGDTLQVF